MPSYCVISLVFDIGRLLQADGDPIHRLRAFPDRLRHLLGIAGVGMVRDQNARRWLLCPSRRGPQQQRKFHGRSLTRLRTHYTEMVLVLASQSPRRAEILRQAGIPFIVRAASVDETALAGELPEHYVCRVAELKALAVECGPGETILGADTTVVIDGEMLAKPADAADARRMLSRLADRRHEVLTGVSIRRGSGVINDWAATHVWFTSMTEDEIDDIRRQRRTHG